MKLVPEAPGKTYLINQHGTNCCNQVMHHHLLDTDPIHITTYSFTYNCTSLLEIDISDPNTDFPQKNKFLLSKSYFA